MTIGFRNAAELEAGGNAGFLRVMPNPGGGERAGALLQINGRGEPIEFTFSRLQLPPAGLWSPTGLERHALRAILASLFEAARRSPLMLLCLAREMPSALFGEDLQVQLPVCRVAGAGDQVEAGPREIAEELLQAGEGIRLLWTPRPPEPASPAHSLLELLAARALLLEPFERIPDGIREALLPDPG